jgi:UDP-4-amino-4,6-dideoxy-N-acetyl-beta-L-altrosamine transaminase
MDNKFLPYGLHWIDEDDIQAVVDVLRSDWITTGPKIQEFEAQMCEYIGCKHAIAVNSGTAALDIAVGSLGLKSGEIITTPFTFVATSNAILYNNLVPVFADIKKDTYNIDPEEIRKKIMDKTKAIIYVDYAGQPCDIQEIKEIADEHDLFLIEDACHALGAEYRGTKVGNYADITVFSFHPVKHITTGEGGMCMTNDDELAGKMNLLRNHGIDKGAHERSGKTASYSYDMKLLGRNYRMTDFQAAIGITQLKKLDSFISKRQEIVDLYNQEFSSYDGITIPYVKKDIKHSWHLYTILLDSNIDRDEFFYKMKLKNIGVNVHYTPVYKHSYYGRFAIDTFQLTITEDVSNRIITLPLFPRMTSEDVIRVKNTVRDTLVDLKGQN